MVGAFQSFDLFYLVFFYKHASEFESKKGCNGTYQKTDEHKFSTFYLSFTYLFTFEFFCIFLLCKFIQTKNIVENKISGAICEEINLVIPIYTYFFTHESETISNNIF